MLPPPPIITRFTGLSMRRSSRITSRMLLGGREEEHLVARLDHRVAVGHDRAVAAEDGGDARVDLRHVACADP